MFDGEPSSDDQFHDFSTARPEPFSEAELQRLADSRRLKNTALRASHCCARKSETAQAQRSEAGRDGPTPGI